MFIICQPTGIKGVSQHTGGLTFGEIAMKLVRLLIASVAISAAAVTTAQARDSFSLGISIGGHDHHHVIQTHRYVPAYHGYYGAPSVYYSAPRVVYYDAPVRYRHFRSFDYGWDRRYYRGHGHKHRKWHNHDHRRRDYRR